jgi:DNA-binding response OmpR family regulator
METPAPSVVIADDNTDLAESLAWCLGAAGYRTEVAHDGTQAVAAARRVRPAIVILDLGMPHLDGYAAGREIRALLGDRVLMIAHTAWGDDAARQRTREAGFDHHIVKTTNVGELLELVARTRDSPALH